MLQARTMHRAAMMSPGAPLMPALPAQSGCFLSQSFDVHLCGALRVSWLLVPCIRAVRGAIIQLQVLKQKSSGTL